MNPTEHQTRQRQGEAAAAVAEGNSQSGMTVECAARNHRGNCQSVLAGKCNKLRQSWRADQAVQPGRMQGMDEDCSAQGFCRSKERFEARISNRDAVHISAYFDAPKTSTRHQSFEL